jgi:hypothetical protein
MEPIIFERGKNRLTFFSDRLEIAWKNRTTHVIYYREVEKITYNPEFGFRDVVRCVFSRGYSQMNSAFVIFFKDSRFPVPTRLSNDEFEKVKNIIPTPIELV